MVVKNGLNFRVLIKRRSNFQVPVRLAGCVFDKENELCECLQKEVQGRIQSWPA